MAAVVQGKRSNYDTDLFQSIIRAIEKLAGKTYGHTDAPDDVSMRVIADHARATTFLVGDGVLPSNEGRGYVLRRIMRRAIRHGKRLGLDQAFLARRRRRGHRRDGGRLPRDPGEPRLHPQGGRAGGGVASAARSTRGSPSSRSRSGT